MDKKPRVGQVLASHWKIVSIQDQNNKIYGFDKAPYKISFTYTGREWDDECG